MKHTIEFNLPEDAERLECHLQAEKNHYAREEVWNRVFRPFYKHGYSTAPEEIKYFIQNSDELHKFMDFLVEEYRDIYKED